MEEQYTIYFNEEKEAFAYEIPNFICMITSELWSKYAGTDKWDIIDGQFIDISETPEYKEKQKEKEKEHISNLVCTKRVFVLMLEELGLDYFEQIEPLINANRQAKLEWTLCETLLRSNPLIDVLAAQLSITPEQIDKLFQYANGEISIEEFKK